MSRKKKQPEPVLPFDIGQLRAWQAEFEMRDYGWDSCPPAFFKRLLKQYLDLLDAEPTGRHAHGQS